MVVSFTGVVAVGVAKDSFSGVVVFFTGVVAVGVAKDSFSGVAVFFTGVLVAVGVAKDSFSGWAGASSAAVAGFALRFGRVPLLCPAAVGVPPLVIGVDSVAVDGSSTLPNTMGTLGGGGPDCGPDWSSDELRLASSSSKDRSEKRSAGSWNAVGS